MQISWCRAPGLQFAEPLLQPSEVVLKGEVEGSPRSTRFVPNATPPVATALHRSSAIHDLPNFGLPARNITPSGSMSGTAHRTGGISSAARSRREGFWPVAVGGVADGGVLPQVILVARHHRSPLTKAAICCTVDRAR
jgi:hypothetical protein